LLGLGSIAGLAALFALAPGAASASGGLAGASGGQGGGCIAHRPAYVEDVFESHYTAGCSGHDEPELDPVSAVPGSAKDITWTVVLPSNGSFFPVDAVGPTFWFGGSVKDPKSLFGQAFEELQFYPNALVSNCNPNGAFVVSNVPGDYTVCSPVWSIHATGQKPNFHEPAAFNAMLTNGSSSAPLVMHAGDTVRVHYFVTAAKNGWHINVRDLTTKQSGTIVLNSKSDGPLMPAYNTQKIGNSLKWGAVHDTPDAFVWEIGHTSPFSSPGSHFCAPGAAGCYSYDAAAWRNQSPPIHILNVTFANGSHPHSWAVVSDYGGKAEVLDPTETGSTCTSYGGPFCSYPWYTRNSDGSFSYGVNYPTTAHDFGKVNQFPQKPKCGGPFGPKSTYCANVVVP
jgi:hypothetical protein